MNLIEKFSAADSSTVVKNTTKPADDKTVKSPEIKNDQKKKLALALGALAIAGVAAIGIAMKAKSGKPVSLSDIKFDKGIATKDGNNFSGKIKDTLKNGDSILLEYKDGIIQTSKRDGKKNISKTFEYLNGDKLVHTTSDGKTSTINITKKLLRLKLTLPKKKPHV